MNFADDLAAMEADPDGFATLRADELYAGFRARRLVRAALKLAEFNGATVVWDEDAYLAFSFFSFRLSGKGSQLTAPVRRLLELAGGRAVSPVRTALDLVSAVVDRPAALVAARRDLLAGEPESSQPWLLSPGVARRRARLADEARKGGAS